MRGRCSGSAGGSDSGVLVAGSPVALILVGGDVNDTMPRPTVGMGCGSRSLPILSSFAALGKGHGKGSPPAKVNLTPPGHRPLAIQEGSLIVLTSSGSMVATDSMVVGDNHALCVVSQRAWCSVWLTI